MVSGFLLGVFLASIPTLLAERPVAPSPVAPRFILHADRDPVEPLRDIVGFSVAGESLLAVRRDGRAFTLEPQLAMPREVATETPHAPWYAAVTSVRGWRIDREYVDARGATVITARCVLVDTTHEQCHAGGVVRTPSDRRGESDARWPATALCRRNADTTVSCVGGLASGRRRRTAHPQRVVTALRFTTLVARADTTCGITTEGAVWCWGPTLRPVVGVTEARSIALHRDVGCALDASGAVACWPLRDKHLAHPRLGLSAALALRATERGPEDDPLGNVRLEGGRVLVRTSVWEARWSTLGGLPPIQSLAAGHRHVCALAESGVVWCWGDNLGGQLGLDDLRSDKDWSTVMVAR